MNMINEIINYELDYMENVVLCHTILTLWNENMIDRSSTPDKIYNIAVLLSGKYPKTKAEKELLDFIGELNKKEYDIIKQKNI